MKNGARQNASSRPRKPRLRRRGLQLVVSLGRGEAVCAVTLDIIASVSSLRAFRADKKRNISAP